MLEIIFIHSLVNKDYHFFKEYVCQVLGIELALV